MKTSVSYKFDHCSLSDMGMLGNIEKDTSRKSHLKTAGAPSPEHGVGANQERDALSASARKRISLAQKARWAKRTSSNG
jgi:hypothetical protein